MDTNKQNNNKNAWPAIGKDAQKAQYETKYGKEKKEEKTKLTTKREGEMVICHFRIETETRGREKKMANNTKWTEKVTVQEMIEKASTEAVTR